MPTVLSRPITFNKYAQTTQKSSGLEEHPHISSSCYCRIQKPHLQTSDGICKSLRWRTLCFGCKSTHLGHFCCSCLLNLLQSSANGPKHLLRTLQKNSTDKSGASTYDIALPFAQSTFALGLGQITICIRKHLDLNFNFQI